MQEKYLLNINQDSTISWAAYHSSQQPVQSSSSPATTAMLPLFNEDSKVSSHDTTFNVCHSTGCKEINSVQVPVITLDNYCMQLQSIHTVELARFL